ncbi:MAG: hypothetical protein IT223_00775 [Crocinitomicaceae bacterium]|nr:hypothetical protein [Crocinitomicaceae bacterium]
MRVVATIPHPHCQISIFSYNEKWIIEIEGGQYRQSYKISQDSVQSVEEVKKLVTPRLLNSTLARFSGMHEDFAEAFQELKKTI